MSSSQTQADDLIRHWQSLGHLPLGERDRNRRSVPVGMRHQTYDLGQYQPWNPLTYTYCPAYPPQALPLQEPGLSSDLSLYTIHPGVGPRPPRPYAPPADKPPVLPAGWTARWDDYYQRCYYVEEVTGHSQWLAPSYDRSSSQAGPSGLDTRASTPALGDQVSFSGIYAPHTPSFRRPGTGPSPLHGDSRGSGNKGKEKENLGGMLLGAAGGLAVGALAGAVLSHGIHDHEERKHERRDHGEREHRKREHENREREHREDEYRAEHVAAAPAAPQVITETTTVYETNSYEAPPAVESQESFDQTFSSSSSGGDVEEFEEVRDEYPEEYVEDLQDDYQEESQEEYDEELVYYD